MSPLHFDYRWEIAPQPLSRLDYIATAMYAAYISNCHKIPPKTWSDAVKEAKAFIAELDKEQEHE